MPTIKSTDTDIPKGKYFIKPSLRNETFISNIMTTNKNRTITAPIYTNISTMLRNSVSHSIHNTAVEKKHKTKLSTDFTGFLDKITCDAESIDIKEKI